MSTLRGGPLCRGLKGDPLCMPELIRYYKFDQWMSLDWMRLEAPENGGLGPTAFPTYHQCSRGPLPSM